MNEETHEESAKAILIKMNNSPLKLEEFYDILYCEANGKLSRINTNVYLKKHYSILDEAERKTILKYIFKDKEGELTIYHVYKLIVLLLDIQIYSPIYIIEKVARIIEKNMKYTSSLQFMDVVCVKGDISKTDFLQKITPKLKLDDKSALIAFRFVDCEKKGIVRCEELIAILDSYFESQNPEIRQKQLENKTKTIQKLKQMLENNNTTIEKIYYNLNNSPPHNEFAKINELYNYLTKELRGDIDTISLKELLSGLNKQEKIYKNDIETLLMRRSSKVLFEIKNNNSTENREVYIKLNDIQVYWISKLNVLLNEIGFAVNSVIDSSAPTKDLIYLEVLSKQLKEKVPLTRASPQEIENMIECLDVNKNKQITLKDWSDISELTKSDKSLRKTNPASVKESNIKRNSFFKDNNNNDLSKLPTKGNFKIINKIRELIKLEFPEEKQVIEVVPAKIQNHAQTPSKNNSHIQSPSNNNHAVKHEVNKSILQIVRENKETPKVKKSIQIDVEDKRYFSQKEVKIDTANIKRDEKTVQKIVKDIQMLDDGGGEAFFINLLENISFDIFGRNTVINVFNIFLKNFVIIERKNLFEVAKAMDRDKDGFVDINDIISFQLEYINYKSVKMPFMSILIKLKKDKIELQQLFAKESLNQEDGVTFAKFLSIFNKNFNFEPPIIKKLHDEIKERKFRSDNLRVIDIIDCVTEYEHSTTNGEKTDIKSKLDILDMKSFETEIKKFVKSYMDIYGKSFDENDFDLPKSITLESFRKFINSVKMSFQLGMSIFFLIKSFNSNKNDHFILKEDLFAFLNSYKENINPQPIDKIVENLEKQGCPLKLCFSNAPYLRDTISCVDLSFYMLKCYPNFSKGIINQIIKTLDTQKTGLISLDNMQGFLMKYTKYGFLPLLEFKKIAALLDIERIDTFEYFQSKRLEDNRCINQAEHNKIFSDKLSSIIANELYVYLCDKSKNSKGYDLHKLTEQVDFYRENHLSFKDVSDVVLKLNKITNNFSNYLKDLNTTKPLGRAFDFLSISDDYEISIIDVMRRISSYYKDGDKKQFATFMKIMDFEKTGYMIYEEFYGSMNKYIIEYEHSIILHLNFLNKYIKKSFNGNYKLFLESKKLRMDQCLKEGEFYDSFKDDFFRDVVLIKELTDSLKLKDGKKLGCIYIQNFVDLLIASQEVRDPSSAIHVSKLETRDLVILLNQIEAKISMKMLYEFIEPQYVTKYGKVSFQMMDEILSKKLALSEDDKDAFMHNFSSLSTHFDLFELSFFLQSHSLVSNEDKEDIIVKMKNMISKSNTLLAHSFFQKYNIDQYRVLSITDILVIIPSIFKITKYQTFIIFKDVMANPQNALKHMTINMDLIFQLYEFYDLFASQPKAIKIKIDNYLKITLRRLGEYIANAGNVRKFFQKYDKDVNGVLTREEFMILLTSFENEFKLSDSQKITIIKLADSNNDDIINFPEFLALLKIQDSERDESQKHASIPERELVVSPHPIENAIKRQSIIQRNDNKSQTIINNKKEETKQLLTTIHKKLEDKSKTTTFNITNEKIEKLTPKKYEIDYKLLKENNTYNSSNKHTFESDPLYYVLYKLQSEINEDNKIYFMCIEELNKKSVSESIVPIESLIQFLEKRFGENNELKEKLPQFFIGKDTETELIKNNYIDYNTFFENLVNLRLGKKEMLLIKQTLKRSKNMQILQNKKSVISKEKSIVDKSAFDLDKEKSKTQNILNLMQDNHSEIEKKEDQEEQEKISGTPKSELLLSPGEMKKKALLESRKILKENLRLKYKKQKTTNIEESKQEEEKEVKAADDTHMDEHLHIIDEKTLEQLQKLGINKDDPQDLDRLKEKLSAVFAHDQSEVFETIMTPKDRISFTNFIISLINLEYTGYDYTIIPEKDYFRRQGKLIKTILNSEDAAIKKCEELFNQIEEGGEFTDKDFGPQTNDNGVGNKFSLYLSGTAMKGHMDPSMIEWYRMTQICPETDPHFLDDGADSNDVMQGALGDCWFISALSVLATKDYLLRGQFNPSILNDGVIDQQENAMLSTGVYPPIFHKFRKKNIFCFRFYKNFQFRYVIIDDKLPCKKTYSIGQVPKLIYGRCRNEKEFWVPLIEKAYAKLHGCYEALISGFIDDGLVDLTGYDSKKLYINSKEFVRKDDKDRFWATLKFFTNKNFDDKFLGKKKESLKASIYLKNNSMIGCSVDSKVVESEVVFNNHKTGIIAGHAYALLDAFEIRKQGKDKVSRLIRIRNPWGFKEWNGKWSDESDEVENNKDRLQEVLNERYKGTDEKVVLDAEDGTFLMCFSDFRQIYNKLFICLDFPPTYLAIRFRDKWTATESGGIPIGNTPIELTNFAKNPQYYVSFAKPTTCYIGLLQTDGRLTKEKFPYSNTTKKNCIVVFKVNSNKKLDKYNEKDVLQVSTVRQHRENSIQIEFAKGEYIVVAAIFKAGDTGEFTLDFIFEDEFKEKYNEKNFMTKFKNTVIKRLDAKYKYSLELISEDVEELHHVMKRKKMFLYKQFKDILTGYWSEKEEYKKHNEEEANKSELY